jgi:hypothetical protein
MFHVYASGLLIFEELLKKIMVCSTYHLRNIFEHMRGNIFQRGISVLKVLQIKLETDNLSPKHIVDVFRTNICFCFCRLAIDYSNHGKNKFQVIPRNM